MQNDARNNMILETLVSQIFTSSLIYVILQTKETDMATQF